MAKLTDTEKRIFLSAMAKEWKLCEEMDKKSSDSDLKLVPVVDGIVQKVMKGLWKESDAKIRKTSAFCAQGEELAE